MSDFKRDAMYRVRASTDVAELSILDSKLTLIKSARGFLQGAVAAGTYLIEARAGAEMGEKIVRLKNGSNDEIVIQLEIPAAAPAGGTSTTHEYHSYPARDLSQKISTKDPAGLMVFGRDLGAPNEPMELAIDFRLEARILDAGSTWLRDSLEQFEQREDQRWSGLTAGIRPGGYQLEVTERRADQEEVRWILPLWACKGWTTAIFVMREYGSAPWMWNASSIHMFRQSEGYQPYEPISLAVELALTGLRTQQQLVSKKQLGDLLHGKFVNPMLGIIGCHLLLMEREPDAVLVGEVLENLTKLVGNHPDVLALRAIAHDKKIVVMTEEAVVDWPPMLRMSYDGLVEHSWSQDVRVTLRGMALQKTAYLTGTGPWTNIRVPAQERKTVEIFGIVNELKPDLEKDADVSIAVSVDDYLNVVESRRRDETTWEAPPAASDVARALKLPLAMVEQPAARTYRRLGEAALERKNFVDADALFERSLEVHQRRGDAQEVVHDWSRREVIARQLAQTVGRISTVVVAQTVKQRGIDISTTDSVLLRQRSPSALAAEMIISELPGLTLKDAIALGAYFKDTYGIEAAAGGGLVIGSGIDNITKAEKDSFNVILTAVDASKKIQVIKVVREVTGLGLREAKALVEAPNTPIKFGLSKDEAEKVQKKVTDAGGTVEFT